MKLLKNLLLTTLLFISIASFSQKKTNPLVFNCALSKVNYKAGDTIEFILNVKIEDGWYLYSSEFPADGPMRFECHIEKSNDFKIMDTIVAYKPFLHYDDVWEADVKVFEKIAQFRIPMIVKKSGVINLSATVEGQVCSDLCVPFNESIKTDLSKLPFSDYVAADPTVYKHFTSENKGGK